ncbi:MAG: hypothetical protein NUV51_03655 [Sulfuricaulis sp.]|nr:hypothetical protein [Sulfuricaulis sp.]
MTRRPLARKSVRDTLLENAVADRYYAGVYGKGPRAQPEITPKRTRVAKPRDPRVILEKDVLKAVLQFLRAHPRVASVERSQSGVFQEGNRIIRVGFVGKLDISGMLKGGRYFEIECKRPGGKPTPQQFARIYKVRQDGGLSGVVTSVEDAARLLAGQ